MRGGGGCFVCMATATVIFRVFLRNRARSLLAPSALRRSLGLAAALFALYFCYNLLCATSGVGEALEREAASTLLRLNAVWADEREAEELHVPHGDHVILDALRKNVVSLDGGGTVMKDGNVLPRILLLYDTVSWHAARAAKIFLEAQSISFDLHRHYPYRLPMLTGLRNGREIGLFSMVLVSSSISVFHNWSEKERQPYFAYCKKYGVPLVCLTPLRTDQENVSKIEFDNLALFPIDAESIQRLSLNSSHTFHYAKSGRDITDHIQRSGRWFGLKLNSSTLSQSIEAQQPNLSPDDSQVAMTAKQYSTLATVTFREADSMNSTTVAMAIQDNGLRDGVVKLFLSSPLTFWLTKLLLMDAIQSLSLLPVLRFGRERWVMVDIDDIFVAPTGTKMVPEDVQVRASAFEVVVEVLSDLTMPCRLYNYINGLTFYM